MCFSVYTKHTDNKNVFPNVHQATLACEQRIMDSIEKNGIYFVSGIKELAISVGGQFADVKERPIVALLQSNKNSDIFWAIPVGDADHREDKQIE